MNYIGRRAFNAQTMFSALFDVDDTTTELENYEDIDPMKDRYNTPWYGKRIKQNKIIKKHLISIIKKHIEHDFPLTCAELGYLNYEDLLEIAIAAVNKKISINLGNGYDFSNKKDGKFSIVRSNSYGKNYSALITNCEHKEYILACVYEGIQEKFYYFSFPATLKQHTIPFELGTGNPKRLTTKGLHPMWNLYQCDTFEDMATGRRKR
jgi:hypothetical protein